MNMLIRWLLTLAPLVACMLGMKPLIHFFQLESYQFPGYFQTIRRNWKQAFFPGTIIAIAVLVLYAVFDKLAPLASPVIEGLFALLLLIFSALLGLWAMKFLNNPNVKKPLRFTARVKRLYVVIGLVFFAIALVHVYWSPLAPAIVVVPILLPFFVALGGLFAWPVEKAISEFYFQDAKKTLAQRPELIKIGITGSFGKTSVKFILDTILSEKYQVLASPGSFNTPMGLTRVIREKLTPSHQVFIAEMGARRKGDIKELCRLVRPDMGIITSVGPQHLDTFKTLERVASTKYELIEGLPASGHGFFVNDGGVSFSLYQKTALQKTLVSLSAEKGDLWAEDIRVSSSGTSFAIVLKQGDRLKGETKLLGTHNIQNILLAVSVALNLGLTKAQIERGIAKLQPVEHRLQLMYNSQNDITIIDDAFNSNPKGIEAALETLKQFSGRKIIITPGMVEMGKDEDEYNKQFGQKMAKIVDIAILVGAKHTKPIAEGLLEQGFNKEQLIIVNTLEESTKQLHRLIRPGDIVLYENDLPDNYNEG